LRKVRHRDVLGEGLDAVQLLERLRGRRRVVVADLRHPDDGDPFAAQRPELTSRDRLRHDVGRTRQAVDVRVAASTAPCALEAQPVLAEGELEVRDRLVELGGEADRVYAETCERVVRL